MTDLVTTISDERLAEMLAEVEIEFDNALSDAEADQNPQLAVDPVGEFDLIELRSILSELQSLRAQGGVRVKPLEWVRVTEPPTCHGGGPKRYWKASDSLGGWVWVNVHSEDFDGEASWGGEKYPSSAAAMSAAEGHRRDRILSSLEASPAPVSGVMAKPTVEQAIESLVSALDEMRSQQAKRDEFLATLIVNIEKNEPTAEFAVNLREYVRNGRAALAAKGGQ